MPEFFWHVFAGELSGIGWALLIAGESPKTPAEMEGESVEGLPWVASFDHDPTKAEKDALTPPEYRDEEEDARV